jgi:hypothetical protein
MLHLHWAVLVLAAFLVFWCGKKYAAYRIGTVIQRAIDEKTAFPWGGQLVRVLIVRENEAD